MRRRPRWLYACGLADGRDAARAALVETRAAASRLEAAVAHQQAALGIPLTTIAAEKTRGDRGLAPPDAVGKRQPRTPAPASARDGARQPGSLGAERKPLAVLASAHPNGMTEAQWAVAAGFKRTGGTWGTSRSRLRAAACIEQEADGRWVATEDGLLALGSEPLPMPPPGPELVAFWASHITGAGPMLRHLAGLWPRATTCEALGEALGLAVGGGTFGTYLSRLRAADLIVEPARGSVRAADHLFPEARS